MTHTSKVHNRLLSACRRALSEYQESDGPAIDIRALIAEFPGTTGRFWMARMLGRSASEGSPSRRLCKIRPVLGRTRGSSFVVLESSLLEWLMLEEDMTEGHARAVIKRARDTEALIKRRNALIHEERLIAGKIQKPGKVAKEKAEPPKAKPFKSGISTDVFSVWSVAGKGAEVDQ